MLLEEIEEERLTLGDRPFEGDVGDPSATAQCRRVTFQRTAAVDS